MTLMKNSHSSSHTGIQFIGPGGNWVQNSNMTLKASTKSSGTISSCTTLLIYSAEWECCCMRPHAMSVFVDQVLCSVVVELGPRTQQFPSPQRQRKQQVRQSEGRTYGVSDWRLRGLVPDSLSMKVCNSLAKEATGRSTRL